MSLNLRLNIPAEDTMQSLHSEIHRRVSGNDLQDTVLNLNMLKPGTCWKNRFAILFFLDHQLSMMAQIAGEDSPFAHQQIILINVMYIESRARDVRALDNILYGNSFVSLFFQ